MSKIGILLPTRGALFEHDAITAWKLITEMVMICEESDINSVWVGDSLSAKPRFEPLTILGAIAGITNRVSIGTSVLLPTLRNPGHLLQTVNTVNSISGGRLILGLGMGGAFNDAQKQEWTNAGIDYRTRRARFEEILQIVDLSRNNDYVNFEGQYYKLSGMDLVQRSKIDYKVIIAAHARHKLNKQFARAAKYGDGFISITDTPAQLGEGCQLFESFLKNEELQQSKEKVMYITVNISDDEHDSQRDAENFLIQYYGANIWGDSWGPFGSPKKIIDRVRDYYSNGATTVIVRFASSDQVNQLRRFKNEILPNI